ncbi:LPXTG cell wall anchor domain-containing protein [Streptococcus merionis]
MKNKKKLFLGMFVLANVTLAAPIYSLNSHLLTSVFAEEPEPDEELPSAEEQAALLNYQKMLEQLDGDIASGDEELIGYSIEDATEAQRVATNASKSPGAKKRLKEMNARFEVLKAKAKGETPAPTTTEAPTTVAPTTVAPTTAAPTTEAPTTAAPTTVAPTTAAPTTVAPTTEAPTTVAPTTVAPTTEAPTTEAPTTAAPTTAAPTTAAPTTEAPTTVAPTTEAPTTVAPTTAAPTSASTTAKTTKTYKSGKATTTITKSTTVPSAPNDKGAKPKTSSRTLPSTGETVGIASLVGTALLGLVGFVSYRRKKN